MSIRIKPKQIRFTTYAGRDAMRRISITADISSVNRNFAAISGGKRLQDLSEMQVDIYDTLDRSAPGHDSVGSFLYQCDEYTKEGGEFSASLVVDKAMFDHLSAQLRISPKNWIYLNELVEFGVEQEPWTPGSRRHIQNLIHTEDVLEEPSEEFWAEPKNEVQPGQAATPQAQPLNLTPVLIALWSIFGVILGKAIVS